MMVTVVTVKAINLQSGLGGKVEILAGNSQKENMFWLSTLAAVGDFNTLAEFWFVA